MPTKRKKFIDKKSAVTFRLVHRSQKDPLVADERAPKHVLFDPSRKDENPAKKRREELKKYGIYFDDDYDYLQHLKDVNRVAYWEPVSGNAPDLVEEFQSEPTLQLPSSVFQSSVEEQEGLLSKNAPRKGPRPDWDPDVVAALDDDFNFNDPSNELDDDFVTVANAECSGENEREESDSNEDDFSNSDHSFGDEETKSHFTNYSLSSSVISRNKGLQMLDEQFEKLYELYEEDEIGALDGEEIHGVLQTDSCVMQNLLKEFELQKEDSKSRLKDIIQKGVDLDLIKEDESTDEEIVKIAVDESKKEDRWDCESILSNYSNLYNRPKLIIETKQKKIELFGRSGLPKDVLRSKGLVQRQLKLLDDDDSSSEDDEDNRTTVSTIRLPNETPEERRARKAVVRQLRKERRMEKKMNKQAFKLEEQRQTQVMRNLKQNLQGMKLL